MGQKKCIATTTRSLSIFMYIYIHTIFFRDFISSSDDVDREDAKDDHMFPTIGNISRNSVRMSLISSSSTCTIRCEQTPTVFLFTFVSETLLA